MRLFKPEYKDRQTGETKPLKRWYVELRIGGRARSVPAFTDKRASGAMMEQIERLAALKVAGELPDVPLRKWIEALPNKTQKRLHEIGLLDGRVVASGKALKEHLADYADSLRYSGKTAEYITKSKTRIEVILAGTKAVFLSDIDGQAVARYLANRRNPNTKDTKPISVKTSNHYLASMLSFCNWLKRQRRITENPLSSLSKLNPATDRRHVRRALEVDELRRLLGATRTGPNWHGMDGESRYWLYRLAAETGLRSNELRCLKRADLNLSDEPTITVQAKSAKNRSAATLPLRSSTATELETFLKGKHPGAAVFNMPRPENVVVMLRQDLKAAGIDYRDDAGRVADFHALRTTFASQLVRSGVDIRTAKDLMRHSTIAMTGDVYACTLRGTLHDAIARLPDFDASELQEQRATGTDDMLHSMLRPSARTGNKLRQRDAKTEHANREKSLRNKPFSTQVSAGSDKLMSLPITTPKGIRTPVAGMKSRCPRPLDDGGIGPRSARVPGAE